MDRLLPKNERARQVLVVVLTIAGTLVFSKFVLPGTGGSRGVPTSVLLRSTILGLVSSVSAAALILVYRTVRVINFAQIALGAVGGELTFELVRYVPVVPFPVALVLGIAASAGIGAGFDLVFGRRFARAPRLVVTVITIVVAFVLTEQLVGAVRRLPFFPPLASRPASDFASLNALHDYLPLRGLHIDFHDGGIPLGFSEVFAVELAVVALLALAFFLRFTKSGVALRAVSENSDRASLLGISVGRLSTLAWAAAGALSGVTVICTGFITTPGAAGQFDPRLLLAPLVGAAIARFRSIPTAVFASVVIIALSESWNFALSRDTSVVSAALLVVLAVALLLQRKGNLRLEQADVASWQAAEEVRPIPAEFDAVTGLKILRYLTIAAVVVVALAVPFVASTGVTTLGENIFLGGIVAVSLVVLTGWAGQVSLGQYGLVSIGVAVGGALTARAGVPFWIAVPLTAAITGGLSLIVGLPALRIRGLFLGVITFAFSIAVTDVVFDRKYFGWLLPTGAVKRPTAFFLNFNDERSMYFLCVAAFALAVVVVVNLRRSRVGRLLIAVRENESNVQSFGVGLLRTKLLAFVISGALCGFAGIMFAHQLRAVTPDGFRPRDSFDVFIYAVIGGVSSVGGVLLGVVFRNVTGHFTGHNAILALITGTLPLVLLYTAPGGILSILVSMRDGVLRIIAQRRRMVVPSLFADYDPDAVERRLIPLGEPVTGTGLDAIPARDRYTKSSELYQGHGVRIADTLKERKPTHEEAAFAAAADYGPLDAVTADLVTTERGAS